MHNKKPGVCVFLDVDDHLLSVRRYFPPSLQYLVPLNQEYRLLETDVAQTVHHMRHMIHNDPSNVIVLGLTKRPLYNPDGTSDSADQVLEKEGIPLTRNGFSHINGQVLLNNPRAGYRNGVIYTAQEKKHLYADAFFKLAKFIPTSISVSDDHRPNIEDMISYGQSKGIPTEGYHFTRVMLLHNYIRGHYRHPSISNDFDPEKYLLYNPDVLKASGTRNVAKQCSFAQHHYVTWGQNENRFTGYPSNFLPQHYLAKNNDIFAYAQAKGFDPIQFAWEHYRYTGYKEQRSF